MICPVGVRADGDAGIRRRHQPPHLAVGAGVALGGTVAEDDPGRCRPCQRLAAASTGIAGEHGEDLGPVLAEALAKLRRRAAAQLHGAIDQGKLHTGGESFADQGGGRGHRSAHPSASPAGGDGRGLCGFRELFSLLST